MFLATYGFNMRYTVCVLRNIVRDDPAWIAMVGGFMAGFAQLLRIKTKIRSLGHIFFVLSTYI